MKALVAAAVLAGLAGHARAQVSDPTREPFTVETEHFVIHYFSGLEALAKRVGVVAEKAHALLVDPLDHRPTEKTIITLVDDTDSANGFAGVLPRNAVTLFATGPSSFSELDDHEDWMLGLFTHEYTHVLHLDTMSGLPNIYNKIFGKTWSPNQIMPRWIIEGIATYEESKRTAGGRNRGTRFDQIIRIARHQDRDLRIDEMGGAPRQFPRGNAAYIYGSHFLRYIFDRFGDDTLREMSHTAGGYPVPFAINRQIAKVTGKPFTELYDDWKGYLRDRYGQQEMAAERRGLVTGRPLTRTAEGNFYAQYSNDGKQLYWVQSDGYRIPHVRTMDVGASGSDPSTTRDVVRIDALGPFDVLADNSLVYEQGGRLYRREYAFQDLHRYDARTGARTRITHGMRARDPSVSPDERRVAFSKNEVSESVLAVVDTAPGGTPSVVWRGQRRDQAYQPAWSPDGTRIAFSAWRRNGYRDILVVELASGKVDEITVDRAIDMNPSWSPDGKTLYFDSDRTGIANIYAFDTTDRSLWQVTNVLGGAFRGKSSPDGKWLVFDAAVPLGGYDLHELAIDRSTWLPARDFVDDRPTPHDVKDTEYPVGEPRKFRPLESLAPQAWTLQTQLAGDTPSAVVTTSGADAVGLHGYQLSIGTNLTNADLNVAALYAYGGFRLPLRLSAARTIGERGGYRVDGVPATYRQEDWSATLSTSIPFEARPESSWTLSFDYDFDYFRRVSEPMALDGDPDTNDRTPVVPISNYRQAGIGTRVGYSRTRGVTYGVGPQSGFDTAVALRLDHPALGATYQNVTVSYSANGFQRLWGKTPVLSARLAGSFRVGDLVRPGSFALGGVPEQDVVRAIIDSTRAGITGYLRGYDPRVVTGNTFHLLNLEYRQELLQIERGLETLPIYIRRVTMALLADGGIAYDGDLVWERHAKTSVGGALRLDAYFGFFLPGTFEVGYARGLDEGGKNEMWFLLTGSL